MTGLLELIGLALPLLALSAWIVVVAAAPHRGQRLATLGPRAARAWLYAPLWAPIVLVAAALLPSLAGLVVAGADHCAWHGAHHHHHLCLLHPPHASGALAAWAIPLAVALPALAALAAHGRRLLRERRLARTLVALSRPSAFGPDVRTLDDPRALAMTVGGGPPTILLSDGLLRRLSPDALAVVLAHERAHVARRDLRASLADRLAAALLPRAVATPLLERLSLARELACDADAAAHTGGPVAVAAALTEVARLQLAPAPVGLSIGASALETRVRQLLTPAPGGRSPARTVRWAAALLVAGAWPIHEGVEHIVTTLLH